MTISSRQLRRRKPSNSTSSEDEEEVKDITNDRDQRYGVYTPEPVQRTLVLRSGDDLEEEDNDESELEDLEDFGDSVYHRKTYIPSQMMKETAEERYEKNMDTYEHEVTRSELKKRAVSAASCFKRTHRTSDWWKAIKNSRIMNRMLKYLRRLWRFMLRNSFMAVNVLWLLAPLCCFVIAMTVPHYVTNAIQYVDTWSTTIIGARGNVDASFDMEAMRSMVLENVDMKVLGMTKEMQVLQQTIQKQERELEALKLRQDSLHYAHNEMQKQFSFAEVNSAIKTHVEKVVAEHTKALHENFLDRTSQLQQNMRSASTQQARLSSVVMKQEAKLDSMQDTIDKATLVSTPDTSSEYACGHEMRNEFTHWRESFERELESEMQRKVQVVESRMMRVLQEEKQALSSSADALRGLDATDPGILRVIEVAVQAVEIKKTGRVDHAALANGASVIHSERDLLYPDRLSPLQLFTQLIGWSDPNDDVTFTSPSYLHAPSPYLSLLLSSREVPWWLSRHNGRPETALSETMEIGSCWGFAGSSGRLSVKFALQIIADSITIDHIPAQIASDFSSAPNEFRILGILGHSLRETVDFVPFGNFSYASNGPASQTFKLTPLQSYYSAIDGITLEVLSNHGHPEYTCLYRFRVHGQPV